MKRLRHPVRAVREPFGTAGLIVACVALILALTGAAFAAAGLTGKQKKEVEKIAKKFAGKPGAPGAAGPAGKDGSNGAAGARGATGAQGAKGATGAQGSAGPKGEAGADGLSPEIVAEGPTLCGGKGGVAYEVEGSAEEAEICNGKEGKDGKEGSPWTAGGTLPPGATETGYWSFTEPAGKIKVDVEGTTKEVTIGPPFILVPISFPIRFSFNIKPAHVHFGIQGSGGAFVEGTGLCPGKFFTPEAAPGELCVYYPESGIVGANFEAINKAGIGSPGASRAGAIIQFIRASETEGAYGSGSYAVTGCEEETGTGECKP